MAAKGKVSFLVAASVGTVEAMKDQVGLCRWNYAFRSVQSRVKQNMGALAQVRNVSSRVIELDEKAKRSEEGMRAVMYLSCWGPN